MSAIVHKHLYKEKYVFLDVECIGRPCFAPGAFQHRAPLAGGGSRNTGSPDTYCCMSRAYHGCPEGPEGETTSRCHCKGKAPNCPYCNGTGYTHIVGVPLYQIKLAQKNKDRGWRIKPA